MSRLYNGATDPLISNSNNNNDNITIIIITRHCGKHLDVRLYKGATDPLIGSHDPTKQWAGISVGLSTSLVSILCWYWFSFVSSLSRTQQTVGRSWPKMSFKCLMCVCVSVCLSVFACALCVCRGNVCA